MPSQITIEQALALAPDQAAATAGRKLAEPRHWEDLGQAERAIWGACRGSAKEPYRVGVDLAGPAFRCSCPSRKFPCKHALGLMLILAARPELLPATDPPDWIGEWLAARARTTERREQREQTPAHSEEVTETTPKITSSAKGRTAREQKVAAGLIELERWLHDQLRAGLASLQANTPAAFNALAARMVDAQAPGIARLLRIAAADAASGEGWQQRLLDRLARLHLLARAYQQRETLDAGVLADVEATIGFTMRQDEVRSGVGILDRWTVIGRRVEQEDRLTVQRTWLWAEHHAQPALLLDFAPPGGTLERTLTPGLSVAAEVVFYPAAVPLRALLKERHGPFENPADLPGQSIVDATAGYADALGRNPWLERWPLILGPVLLTYLEQRWYAQDSAGRMLPLAAHFGSGWRLLAISGGMPVTLVGEWDGEQLTPLSAQIGERMITFGAG